MCYNGFTIKKELFKYKRFKDWGCAHQIIGSNHLKSSLTLASLKNRVRKVDIENLIRTDTCKNRHLCNS